MKFIQVLAIIIATVVLTNCSKKDATVPITKGTLVFTNNSANPYQVEVNGVKVINSQAGNSTEAVQYTTGPVSIRVLQLSGYVLYPTEKTFTGTLTSAGTLTTTYP